MFFPYPTSHCLSNYLRELMSSINSTSYCSIVAKQLNTNVACYWVVIIATQGPYITSGVSFVTLIPVKVLHTATMTLLVGIDILFLYQDIVMFVCLIFRLLNTSATGTIDWAVFNLAVLSHLWYFGFEVIHPERPAALFSFSAAADPDVGAHSQHIKSFEQSFEVESKTS